MKQTGRTLVSLLIALALVLGGLCYGARKGFLAESQALQTLYAKEGGLQSMLALRAADAGNLLTVARRHLSKEHPAILAVEQARGVLLGSAALSQKHQADQALTGAVETLAGILKELPSLQGDAKDWNYVLSLAKALEVYAGGEAASAYNDAAQSYNQRLEGTFGGRLALLMGAAPAQLFHAAP